VNAEYRAAAHLVIATSVDSEARKAAKRRVRTEVVVLLDLALRRVELRRQRQLGLALADDLESCCCRIANDRCRRSRVRRSERQAKRLKLKRSPIADERHLENEQGDIRLVEMAGHLGYRKQDAAHGPVIVLALDVEDGGFVDGRVWLHGVRCRHAEVPPEAEGGSDNIDHVAPSLQDGENDALQRVRRLVIEEVSELQPIEVDVRAGIDHATSLAPTRTRTTSAYRGDTDRWSTGFASGRSWPSVFAPSAGWRRALWLREERAARQLCL
jgi:hypothetical protein